MAEPQFKMLLVQSIPSLRSFAMSLAGSRERADDLVQETLVKAWANQDKFAEGSNLKAWLFTILRNEFYTYFRRRKNEVEDADGSHTASLTSLPNQDTGLIVSDVEQALQQLSPDQREALMLLTASDMSYEEAAEICGVAVGTIKSRVNRARAKLATLLDAHTPSDYGVSATLQAALAAKPD